MLGLGRHNCNISDIFLSKYIPCATTRGKSLLLGARKSQQIRPSRRPRSLFLEQVQHGSPNCPHASHRTDLRTPSRLTFAGPHAAPSPSRAVAMPSPPTPVVRPSPLPRSVAAEADSSLGVPSTPRGANPRGRKRPAPSALAGADGASSAGKKVRWTPAATTQLLDFLSDSSERRAALKSASKHKKLGLIYKRWAEILNTTNSSQAFTGPKVMAKIKKVSSAWRSIHEQVSKLRNRGAATKDVDDKKGMY